VPPAKVYQSGGRSLKNSHSRWHNQMSPGRNDGASTWTLTEKNADISLKALEAGAADYIPKPTSTSQIAGASTFRQDLLEKIKILGATARRDSGRPLPITTTRTIQAPGNAPGETNALNSIYSKPIALRQGTNAQSPEILAIGSSTGGPQALRELFKSLKPTIGVPIVITQHMPATFTRILAEHISKATGWTCTEALEGEGLKPNHAYIAPGDYHMEIVGTPTGPCFRMNQNPPVNFCRPAVDPMLKSVVKLFGSRVLAAILAGMGNDGLEGSKEVIDAGGTLIAQDEASSVVWGMPGAVATAGFCSAILPLPQIGGHIMRFVGKGS